MEFSDKMVNINDTSQNQHDHRIIASHLFNYLSLSELTTLADAHAILRTPAKSIFGQKYNNETVVIDESGFICSTSVVLDQNIRMKSDIESATFLRLFGHLVLKLEIDYSNRNFLMDDPSNWSKIERDIVLHCADSLQKLKIQSFDAWTFNKVHESFPAITKLSIHEGDFRQNLSRLCQWFPSVKHLKLVNSTFSDPKHIEATFPALTKLTLKHDRQELSQLSISNVVSCLHRNSHLQSLCLMVPGMNKQMLNIINDSLPNLTELTFQLTGNENSPEDAVIDFQTLTQLTIYLPEKNECQVSLSAANLKNLCIIGYSASYSKWTDFITKCTNLISLGLTPGQTIMTKKFSLEELMPMEKLDENLTLFAKTLPQLTILYLFGDFISTSSHLCRFVAECETLKTLKLAFRCSNQHIRESFATALGTDWKAVHHTSNSDYKELTLEY